jgi:hypothetical protein
MIDKVLTGYAAKLIYDKLRLEDKTAAGSNSEIRDNKNVGMEDGHVENHSFDLSTRDSLNLMNQRKAEGKQVTGKDMDAVIKNAADSGQITREEWMDLREWVTANYDSLSPEAKAKFDKLDTAIQTAGQPVGWFDGKHDGKTRNDAVIKGPELKTLIDDIGGKGHGKADSVDHGGGSVDHGHHHHHAQGAHHGNGGVKHPSQTEGGGGTQSAHGTGGSEGAKGAKGLGISAGDSWEVIMAKIMEMIDKKEAVLKQRATEVAGRMDKETKRANEANGGTSEGTDVETTKANEPNSGGGTERSGGTDSTTRTEGGAKAGGPQEAETKSMNTELTEIQAEMDKLKQLTQLVTNLLKGNAETTMSVVRNVGV